MNITVDCLPLIDLPNGATTCMTENGNGVLTFEDICVYTCNTGYLLIGNSFRMCQKDGSWSGTEPICKKGGQ